MIHFGLFRGRGQQDLRAFRVEHFDKVEGVWAPIAERDDWSAFEAKLADIAEMREALAISCHQSVAAEA